MDFDGIEHVDPAERARQHALADAFWQTLEESRIGSGVIGRITGLVNFSSQADAESFCNNYEEDWETKIQQNDENNGWLVQIISPDCEFSRLAFIELVDVLMIDAAKANGEFDGFHLDSHNIGKRNWWKFWR